MQNPIFKSKYENLKVQLESLKTRGISYQDEYESIILDGILDLIEKPNLIESGIKEVNIDDGLSTQEWFLFQQNMVAFSQIINSAIINIGEELNKTITKVLADVTTTNEMLSKQQKRYDILEAETKQKLESISISKETNIVGTSKDKASGSADIFPCITFRSIRTDITPTDIRYTIKCPDSSSLPLKLNKKIIGQKDSDLFKNGYYLGILQPSDKYGSADFYSNSITRAFDKNIDKKFHVEYNIFDNSTYTLPLSVSFELKMPTTNGAFYITTASNADKQTVSFNGNKLDAIDINTFYNGNGQLYSYVGSGGVISLLYEATKPKEFESTKLALNNINNINKLNLIESMILSSTGLYKPLTPAIKRYLESITDDVDKFLSDTKKSVIHGVKVDSIRPYYTSTKKYEIDIPEINIQSVTFLPETEALYISKEYTLDQFSSVEITSVDYQPSNTPSSIRYFISTNKNKNNWYEIRPTNWSITDYNVNIPSRINFEDEPTSIYVKIELSRLDNSYDVPWIYKYTIRAKHS